MISIFIVGKKTNKQKKPFKLQISQSCSTISNSTNSFSPNVSLLRA